MADHLVVPRMPALSLLTLCLLALIMALTPRSQAVERTTELLDAPPRLETQKLAKGTLYALTVPADSRYIILPAVSDKLSTIESAVWNRRIANQQPLFLINGGFFDPSNHLTTSFVFERGVLTADPRQNHQMTGNEKLKPYLPKILNRPEFRIYLCQENGRVETRYDIASRNAPLPKDCLLQEALGAGPTLLPKVADVAEGFVDYNAQGKVIRDPIGVCALNARSVVGITEDGDVILMMGAQDPQNLKETGFTLSDMAVLLKARGAVKAMALDGGSSSGFMFQGQPVYGKFNPNGSPIKRPVKSVLMVAPR